MFAYLLLFTGALGLVIHLLLRHNLVPKSLLRLSSQLTISNVAELLCLFENNKTLPIGSKTKWVLVEVVNGMRVWKKELSCAAVKSPMKVVGAYSQVSVSPQILTSILTNSKTQKHWNSYLPKNSVIKTFPLNPTLFEREAMYIEMKQMTPGKGIFDTCAKFLNKFRSKQARINNIRNDFIRCWRAVEEGGLLLVEHSLSFHRWVFYLVSPVLDEAEESTITVITTTSSFPSFKELFVSSSLANIDPTSIIAGLKDFIETKILPSSIHLSLTPKPAKSVPTKAETNAIELIKSDIADVSPGREDISIFQKFKNLWDEKRDEQNRIKNSEPSTPLKAKSDSLGAMEVIRRFSLSGKLFDEKKAETTKDKTTSSSSSSSSSLPAPASRWDVLSRTANKENHNIKALHKTSHKGERSRLVKYLDTLINATAEEVINEKSRVSNLDIKAGKEEQAASTGGWIYCGLEKDTVILKKQRSSSQPFHSYMSKGMLPCPPKLVCEVLRKPENRMSYDDIIKKVEVLEECGCDVNIVRLLYEVGQNFKREKRQMVVVQGERMEGLKHVITMTSVDWPAVKTQHGGDEENDDKGRAEGDGCDDGSEEDDDVADDGGDGRRGGTRDPASKKKKNGREDVGSRRDGRGKLDSDFYNKQPGNINNVVDDDVVVDKMGASGWIVEPLMKGDNLCAMVTYVSQMEFKEGTTLNKSLSQMVVDIALKQPLCLKHLRNYISSLALFHSSAESKEDAKRNVTLSLSGALAKFRNFEAVPEEEIEKFDHEEKKEEEEEDYTNLANS